MSDKSEVPQKKQRNISLKRRNKISCTKFPSGCETISSDRDDMEVTSEVLSEMPPPSNEEESNSLPANQNIFEDLRNLVEDISSSSDF